MTPGVEGTGGGSAGTILLVEDDRGTSDLYEHLLRGRGYQILRATTVAEAKSILGTVELDWIVLDLGLPDGNGLEVLRYIQDKRLKTRVAVVTGVSDPNALWEVTRLHPDALLRKPIMPNDLLRTVADD